MIVRCEIDIPDSVLDALPRIDQANVLASVWGGVKLMIHHEVRFVHDCKGRSDERILTEAGRHARDCAVRPIEG